MKKQIEGVEEEEVIRSVLQTGFRNDHRSVVRLADRASIGHHHQRTFVWRNIVGSATIIIIIVPLGSTNLS